MWSCRTHGSRARPSCAGLQQLWRVPLLQHLPVLVEMLVVLVRVPLLQHLPMLVEMLVVGEEGEADEEGQGEADEEGEARGRSGSRWPRSRQARARTDRWSMWLGVRFWVMTQLVEMKLRMPMLLHRLPKLVSRFVGTATVVVGVVVRVVVVVGWWWGQWLCQKICFPGVPAPIDAVVSSDAIMCVCRAGHAADWTLIVRTKGCDKAQILQVTTDTVLYAKAKGAITPLGVCEKVMEVIQPVLADMRPPVKGNVVLPELRNLAMKARERVLAEAAASIADK